MAHTAYRTLAGLVAGILAWPLQAQERVAVDLEAGREIVNDWTYGFRAFAATNHELGLLFVFDQSDPLVAIAISLADGSVAGRYGRGRGEGPGELRQLTDVAAATNGILVSDGARVNHWHLDGTLIGSYSAAGSGTTSTMRLCSLRDQPVVPGDPALQWRDSTGSWRAVGPGRLLPGTFELMAGSHLACFGDVAYALYERLGGYPLDGGPFEVAIPPELQDASRRWRESIRPPAVAFPYGGLTHDGEGRLFVVAPKVGPGNVVGAFVDPAGGCYRVVTDPDPRTRSLRRVMGIYRDSVIIAGSQLSERVIEGVPTMVIDPGSAHMIKLHPLRPDGGEPC